MVAFYFLYVFIDNMKEIRVINFTNLLPVDFLIAVQEADILARLTRKFLREETPIILMSASLEKFNRQRFVLKLKDT